MDRGPGRVKDILYRTRHNSYWSRSLLYHGCPHCGNADEWPREALACARPSADARCATD